MAKVNVPTEDSFDHFLLPPAKKKGKQAKRLPDSVMVMGQKFTIIYESLEGALGECHAPFKLIKIDNRQSPEAAESSLFHEMLHAALYLAGLSTLLDPSVEEAVVVALEHAFEKKIDYKKLPL